MAAPTLPRITQVQIAREQAAADADGLQPVAAIGLVLEDGFTAWAACGPDAAPDLIRAHLDPLLLGQRLTNFRHLAARVEGVQQQVEVVAAAPPAEGRGGLSRRQLLTGRLRDEHTAASPPPARIEMHPLPAGLRFGASLALLAAVAHAQGRTPAAQLAAEYGLPPPAAPLAPPAAPPAGPPAALPPLLPWLAPADVPTLPHFYGPGVAAAGISFAGSDAGESIGAEAVALQSAIRLLAPLLAGLAPPPVLYLDLAGGLATQTGRQSGKMLGALWGLERLLTPARLWIGDPAIDAGGRSDHGLLHLLLELLRARKMETQIVARAGLHTLTDIEEMLAAKVAHLLVIEPARLGGLNQTFAAAEWCRTRNVGVILGGAGWGALTTAEMMVQAALALRPAALETPHFLSGAAGLLLMQRLVAAAAA